MERGKHLNMYSRKKAYIIPYDKAEELWRDAIKVARSVRVDQLSPGSFARSKTDKTVDEVIDIIINSDRPHLVFIERQPIWKGTEPYYDIGGSTMCYSPEYFLWIEVHIPEAEQLVEKYQLKRLQ